MGTAEETYHSLCIIGLTIELTIIRGHVTIETAVAVSSCGEDDERE